MVLSAGEQLAAAATLQELLLSPLFFFSFQSNMMMKIALSSLEHTDSEAALIDCAARV